MGKITPINSSRVDLHRDLVTALEVNQRIQSFAKLAELLLVEMGGRPTAEVNLPYVQRSVELAAELAQVVDLLQKMVEKELNLRSIVGDDDVAQAVVAQLRTERDMNIYMEWLARSHETFK